MIKFNEFDNFWDFLEVYNCTTCVYSIKNHEWEDAINRGLIKSSYVGLFYSCVHVDMIGSINNPTSRTICKLYEIRDQE